MKKGACITARNEAATIRPLVRELKDNGFSVYLNDDGSTDGTSSIVHNYEVAASGLVHYESVSQGYARGMMNAWEMALDDRCDCILQIDAGGSHQVKDGMGLMEAVWAMRSDMGYASRFHLQSAYRGRAWRKWASRGFSGLMNLTHREEISDWTSGLRVFRKPLLAYLARQIYRCTGHGWNAEVMLMALEWGADVMESPMTYTAGDSSLRLWPTLKEIGKLL